jgi:hypothetical protein
VPSKPKTMKTFDDLTEKQIAFVNALVADWGVISKKDAVIKAGYSSKSENSAMVLGSRLTNPEINPHVCRFLERRLSEEQAIYEKDKLRRYKTLERLRDGSEKKGQYTAAINAEFSIVFQVRTFPQYKILILNLNHPNHHLMYKYYKVLHILYLDE